MKSVCNQSAAAAAAHPSQMHISAAAGVAPLTLPLSLPVHPSPLTLSSSYPVPALGPLVPLLPPDAAADEPDAAATDQLLERRQQSLRQPFHSVASTPSSFSFTCPATATATATAAGAVSCTLMVQKAATGGRPRSRGGSGSGHNELRAEAAAVAPDERAPLVAVCAGGSGRGLQAPLQPMRTPQPGESLVWSGAQQTHSLKRGSHQHQHHQHQHQHHVRPFLTPVHEVLVQAATPSADARGLQMPRAQQAAERSASANEAALAGGGGNRNGTESPASSAHRVGGVGHKRELPKSPPPPPQSPLSVGAGHSSVSPLPLTPTPIAYAYAPTPTPTATASRTAERGGAEAQMATHQPFASFSLPPSGRDTAEPFAANSASSIRRAFEECASVVVVYCTTASPARRPAYCRFCSF